MTRQAFNFSEGDLDVLARALGTDGDSHLEHLRYIGDYLRELPIAHTPEPTAAACVALLAPLVLARRRRMAA